MASIGRVVWLLALLLLCSSVAAAGAKGGGKKSRKAAAGTKASDAPAAPKTAATPEQASPTLTEEPKAAAAPKAQEPKAATAPKAEAAPKAAASPKAEAAPKAAAAPKVAEAAAAAAPAVPVAGKVKQFLHHLADATIMQKIAYTFLALFAVICRAKILMWLRGCLFFVLWKEKSGMSKHRDSSKVTASESKIIIFVRHGESDWNYIFNKNKLLLLPRLIMGAIWEAFMFPFKNSLFIDSPLSTEGVEQALALQKFIDGYKRGPDTSDDVHEALSSLRGDPGALPSVLVSSNLRRAIATGCISMWPRLQRTKERTLVLSTLQEMSRNVDTTALAGARELPEISTIRDALGPKFKAKQCLDVSQSTGSKGFKSKALKRMEEFCAWCFLRPEPVIIVSAGHSLWFKNFWKMYLPHCSDHHAKDLKMVNCGVVVFNLEKGVMNYDRWQTGYRVNEESLISLYGGYEKLKKEVPRKQKLKLPSKKENGHKETNGKNGHNNGKDSSMCCTGR